jgi:hypothetical protein
MEVSPKISFWVGVAVVIEQAIGTGAVNLSNAIPADWIPSVVAWNNILGFVGSTFMTIAAGFSSRERGPLVPPPK